MLRLGNPLLFPLSPSSDCPCGFQGGETARRKTTCAFFPIHARKQKANHAADLCMLKPGANPRRRGRRGCPPGAGRDGGRGIRGTGHRAPLRFLAGLWDPPALHRPAGSPGVAGAVSSGSGASLPPPPDDRPVGAGPGSSAPLRETPSSRPPARARSDIPQNGDRAGSGAGVGGAPRVQSGAAGGTSAAVGCCPFPLPL